ncbi:flagellin [Bacillus sp. ISL-37]|uniref:flagellin n=1 Tax=Bacillus sp. ISL-37 TaxID=2819123 RepID=UPI001BECC81B|nr:flagellin [Bacillus sp. ISL-37]MBT2685449.1 flagellin [Bacillus sp. ISL-37]
MRIRNNITALRASNQIGKNESLLAKAHSKLSSGLRINQAADDAAGLAISEKMRAQIRGLETAQRNVQDAVNLIQTAETALGQISNESLLRLRELAVQAANDTMTEADRQHIQDEVEQIKQGIDNIANSTIFNEVELLNQPISEASTTQRVIEMGSYAQVIAPNSMPVGFAIKSGVNDQLSFHINDTIKEITITPGIYNDLPSFIEELNRQMKNEDIPLSASLANNTKKLMFTSPIGEYEIKDISGSAEGYLLPLSTANRTSGISMNGLPVLSPEVTITEGVNDTLTFDIDSVTYSITIAAGTYTVYNASASHLNGNSPLLEEINHKLIAANAPVSARFIYYVNGDTPFNNGAGLYFTALENNDESAFLENGSHSFGNFGGNAKTTLFDQVMNSSGWGYQDAADYTRSGTVVTYPSTVLGEADLSDGVTILAGQNDILSFDINGVSNSITISQGSYDSNSLIEELNHQFTSNSIEMQASLNAFNKLVLSKTNPFDDDIIRNITGTAKGDLFFESIKGKPR